MTANISSGCSFGQAFVDRTPAYDGGMKKRKFSSNQVMSRKGIIRPNKRKKVKFL